MSQFLCEAVTDCPTEASVDTVVINRKTLASAAEPVWTYGSGSSGHFNLSVVLSPLWAPLCGVAICSVLTDPAQDNTPSVSSILCLLSRLYIPPFTKFFIRFHILICFFITYQFQRIFVTALH